MYRHSSKIFEAFVKYEHDQLRKETFVQFLRQLGLEVGPKVLRVLRQRDEVGSSSYTQLIQSLCSPDPPPPSRATPVRSQVPRHSPEYPKTYKHMTRRPQSLLDSNPITWDYDPKKVFTF